MPVAEMGLGALFGSSPSAPTPPNPYDVSNAQTASNIQTAQATAGLNRVNQYGPNGNVTWAQNPTTGQWEQNTTLNPNLQALQANVQGGAATQSGELPTGAVSSSVAMPGDPSAMAKQAQDAAYQQQTQYLDPQFANSQHDLQVQLANQGITAESNPAAYAREMDTLNRAKTQAYGNAADQAVQLGNTQGNALYSLGLQGNQQSFGQNLTNAQLPYQRLAQLLATSPQMPSYSPVPTTSVAPTNTSGNVYSSYAGQMQNYGLNVGQQNAMMNGLFTLGGAALMA